MSKPHADSLKILDVTLRDGGYRNNFNFSEDCIKTIISKLSDANIDFIEVGYRNGSFKPIKNIGITGISDDNYLTLVHQIIRSARTSVIYHPKNVNEQDIVRMNQLGVDMLRCCYDLNNTENSLKYIQLTKELGMISCVNFTRISKLPRNILIQHLKLLQYTGVDVIYLADSNGSLTPEVTANLVKTVKDTIDVEVGFHAHNNLHLAIANAVCAIDNGATFIDCSLRGMGKGAGNLQTEFWIAYLMKMYNDYKYDLGIILELVDYLAQHHIESSPEISTIDIMSGLLDMSIEEKHKLSKMNFTSLNTDVANLSFC